MPISPPPCHQQAIGSRVEIPKEKTIQKTKSYGISEKLNWDLIADAESPRGKVRQLDAVDSSRQLHIHPSRLNLPLRLATWRLSVLAVLSVGTEVQLLDS